MVDKNTGASIPPDWALRRLIAAEIKRSDKKRPQIALEMAALIGVPVTEHMLNDFTSKSKSGARFPAAFVKAFCEVVGSSSLQRFLDDEAALALIQVGEHARDCRRLVERIAVLLDQVDSGGKPNAQSKKKEMR
jgi:hypothetical protein